jgi:hypothetical protein
VCVCVCVCVFVFVCVCVCVCVCVRARARASYTLDANPKSQSTFPNHKTVKTGTTRLMGKLQEINRQNSRKSVQGYAANRVCSKSAKALTFENIWQRRHDSLWLHGSRKARRGNVCLCGVSVFVSFCVCVDDVLVPT